MDDSNRFPLLVNLINKAGRYFIYSVSSDDSYLVADFLDCSIERCTKSQVDYLRTQVKVYGVSANGITSLSVDDYLNRVIARLKMAGYSVSDIDFQYCYYYLSSGFRQFEDLIANSEECRSFVLSCGDDSSGVVRYMNRGDITDNKFKYYATDTITKERYQVNGYQVSRALQYGHDFLNLVGGVRDSGNIAEFLLVDNIITPIRSIMYCLFDQFLSTMEGSDSEKGLCSLSSSDKIKLCNLLDSTRDSIVFSTVKERSNTFACSLRRKSGSPPWILFEFSSVSVEDIFKWMNIKTWVVDSELREAISRTKSPKKWLDLCIKDLPYARPSSIQLDTYIRRNRGFMTTAGVDIRVDDLCLG